MLRRLGNMSFSVIVVAVISLVVLVIVLSLFSGRMNVFSGDLEKCSSHQGECMESCKQGYVFKSGNYSDCSNDQKCCVYIYGDPES